MIFLAICSTCQKKKKICFWPIIEVFLLSKWAPPGNTFLFSGSREKPVCLLHDKNLAGGIEPASWKLTSVLHRVLTHCAWGFCSRAVGLQSAVHHTTTSSQQTSKIALAGPVVSGRVDSRDACTAEYLRGDWLTAYQIPTGNHVG